jgi:hypothetical protein
MRFELFKAAEINIVVLCGREDHHSLFGGSADLTQIGQALNFSHGFRDSEALALRSLNFWLCFVTIPREALLAVLRSLRQMLADKTEELNKRKRPQGGRPERTMFSFVVFQDAVTFYSVG